MKYRKEILDSALNGFEKMLLENKNGTKPLFRNRSWNLKEKLELKAKKKSNWFNNHKKRRKQEIRYHLQECFICSSNTKGGAG